MSITTRLRAFLNLSKKHKYHDVPSDLSDHLYRDIGLSETDVERLRLELPSRDPHGPKL